MTTDAANPITAANVIWEAVAAAEWERGDDAMYHSPDFPGCTLTLLFRGPTRSMANGNVIYAVFDDADGRRVSWNCPWVVQDDCATASMYSG